MIDGFKLQTEISDFPEWKLTTGLDFHQPINTETGELISNDKKDYSTIGKLTNSAYQTYIHTAKYETYDLVVSEVARTGYPTKYYLKISGSLHKNRFNGANYKSFHYTDMVQELYKLCNTLNIDSKKTKILNLEFGVNILVNFVPHTFLKEHLINYKNIPFNQYAPDRKSRRLGYECILSQYLVKIYDKSLQFDLPFNLMRFELKFKKMKILNTYGIKVLHDLTDFTTVYSLKDLLLQAWKDVLLYEPMDVIGIDLTDLQKELINKGDNPKFWTSLNNTNKRKLYYQKAVYRDLLVKYGKGYHPEISSKIEEEWHRLFTS